MLGTKKVLLRPQFYIKEYQNGTGEEKTNFDIYICGVGLGCFSTIGSAAVRMSFLKVMR
jgi:hypothetical protein